MSFPAEEEEKEEEEYIYIYIYTHMLIVPMYLLKNYKLNALIM